MDYVSGDFFLSACVNLKRLNVIDKNGHFGSKWVKLKMDFIVQIESKLHDQINLALIQLSLIFYKTSNGKISEPIDRTESISIAQIEGLNFSFLMHITV